MHLIEAGREGQLFILNHQIFNQIKSCVCGMFPYMVGQDDLRRAKFTFMRARRSTMYLSKIVFSWPACRNPYEWHRSIWKLFPEKSKDDGRGFLFTCLDRRSGRNVSAILLSKGEPKYRSGEEIELVGESKSLADLCFKLGQVLRFKLIANPTKVLTEQNTEKGKSGSR